MRADQVRNLLRTSLQYLHELTRRLELIFVGRLCKQLHSFLVRRLLFFRSTRETEMAECILIVPEHAVEERVSCIHAVAKDHMRQFHGEDGGEACFIGKHVDQTTAENDGVADNE